MSIITMQVGYKYRLYPTRGQAMILNQWLGNSRYAWNRLLDADTEHLASTGSRLKDKELDACLRNLASTPGHKFLNRVSSIVYQQVRRDYRRALREAVSIPERGYPVHKRKSSHYDSIRITGKGSIHVQEPKQAKDRYGWVILPCPKHGTRLRLKYRSTRPLPSEPSSYTITRVPSGEYYISFTVMVTRELVNVSPEHELTGFDAGLTDLLTAVSSDGSSWVIPVPGYQRRVQDKLSRLDKELSGKTRGSANYEEARVRRARAYEHVACQRADYSRKTARCVVRDNQTTCIESLSVKDIQASHGYSAQDACLGRLLTLIQEYASSYYADRVVSLASQWYPSTRKCSACGYRLKEGIPVEYRSWVCPACGSYLHRDLNAAVNLMLAHGGWESLNAPDCRLVIPVSLLEGEHSGNPYNPAL